MKDETKNEALATPNASSIQGLIYALRGDQAMLDSDLAKLYGVETGALNRAASRNAKRFPPDFRFQLTNEEFDSLKCQAGISNEATGRGGRRYLPYAYTEQGIAMLSSVLRSDTAIETSVRIVRAFVEMRRFLASNAQLFEQLRGLEIRQHIDQERNEERFNELFGLLEARGEPAQHIFFDGQVYDAFELLANIMGKARDEIVLIDGYVDLNTLNILAKKQREVRPVIWTKQKGNKLTPADIETFQSQYGPLELNFTDSFHDRFIILDKTIGYHIGASIKDAGKKCFGISLVQDKAMVEAILGRLRS